MSNKPITRLTTAIAFMAALATGSVATAQTQVSASTTLLQDLGSAERIQRAGSLRMLSQRISATSCNMVAGINTVDANKYLTRAIRDYRRVLAGMVNGDAGLGMYAPEEDRVILRDLAALNTIWAPINSIFESKDSDALNSDDVLLIAEAAPQMLELSKRLLGFVVAEYSDPSQMLQSDAVLLQIAERQRMLEQEFANATCLIGEGIQIDAARETLYRAIDQYEVSLDALRTGRADAGVAPPPTKAIDLWLGDVSERWSAVRPTLEAIAQTGSISPTDRTVVFDEMNKLTWMMNVTVGQYTEASKFEFYRSR